MTARGGVANDTLRRAPFGKPQIAAVFYSSPHENNLLRSAHFAVSRKREPLGKAALRSRTKEGFVARHQREKFVNY